LSIIWLNGPSSSGKTTIAKVLQGNFTETFLHVTLDAFLDMLPTRASQSDQRLSREIQPVVRGFYGAVFALARAGNKLIVDDVIVETDWLRECVWIFSQEPVLFVGVRCRPETLEERERIRGDRHIGQAVWQLPRVHAHGVYDVEVDTSSQAIEECAQRILKAFASPPRPSAFERLRVLLSKPANQTVDPDARKSGARRTT
jgi:chloramphenicol 3-O phosphotransferase